MSVREATTFVSTGAVRLPCDDLEAHLAAYVAGGLTAIELGWAPPPRDADFAARLAARSDCRFLIHNYFPQPTDPFVLNLASRDATVRARSLAMARDCLALSARLGAPFYSVHAGFAAEFRPESLGRHLDRDAVVPRADALETFRASVLALAEVGASLGVRVLIEPNVVDRRNLVEGANRLLLLAEAQEIAEFLVAVGRSEVGVLLDLGHLNVSSRTLGFDRADFIDVVAPWVGGLHVHDNDGSADQHRPPGDGSWVLDVVRDARFRALPMVVESSHPNVAALADHARWFTEARLQPLVPQ